MKAAFRRGKDVFVKDCEERPLLAGQIRIAVDACGVCGTDVHAPPSNNEQVITGHEAAGRVLELGPGVSGLTVGQRVVFDSSSPCGRCANCRNTKQELCTDVQSFFINGSYGFAERMVGPAISAIPFDGLTPDVACLQEPLGVAIDMVRLADLEPASNLLILGQGPIGLMATAIARRMGVRRLFVTSPSKRQRRNALAKQFGADAVIDPEALAKYDFGCPIDRILVTAPPRTIAEAIEVAAKGAILSYIGIEWTGSPNITFDANKFHFKKLQLRASFASPSLFGPLALQYLKEGVVDGEALISHRFKLADMAKAMDVARSDADAVKVVVNP